MFPVLTVPHKAGADILPRQIVKLNTDGNVVPATAAADKVIGVSDARGASSEAAADIYRIGIAEVQLGGAVTLGAEITANAQGFGVAATAAGNESIGRAEQAGVAGDIIDVFLRLRTM